MQARHVFSHFVGDEMSQRGARVFQQVFAGFFNGLDDVAVQHPFQAVVLGMPVRPVQAGTEQFFTVHLAPQKRLSQWAEGLASP